MELAARLQEYERQLREHLNEKDKARMARLGLDVVGSIRSWQERLRVMLAQSDLAGAARCNESIKTKESRLLGYLEVMPERSRVSWGWNG